MNDKSRKYDKKGLERAMAVAFPMGNIVFPTHLANAQTPYCPTRSKPMAAAIHLLFAYSRSGKGNRACSEILRKNRNQTVNGGATFEGRKTGMAKSFSLLVKKKPELQKKDDL